MSCLTKASAPSLPFYLPMPFLRALAQSKMQTTLSRIWTQINYPISCDSYVKHAPFELWDCFGVNCLYWLRHICMHVPDTFACVLCLVYVEISVRTVTCSFEEEFTSISTEKHKNYFIFCSFYQFFFFSFHLILFYFPYFFFLLTQVIWMDFSWPMLLHFHFANTFDVIILIAEAFIYT